MINNIQINVECLQALLYTSLWLVKALRLYATPAMLGYVVIEGAQIVGPRMMSPISNLTTAAFLLVEETGVPGGNNNNNNKNNKNGNV